MGTSYVITSLFKWFVHSSSFMVSIHSFIHSIHLLTFIKNCSLILYAYVIGDMVTNPESVVVQRFMDSTFYSYSKPGVGVACMYCGSEKISEKPMLKPPSNWYLTTVYKEMYMSLFFVYSYLDTACL